MWVFCSRVDLNHHDSQIKQKQTKPKETESAKIKINVQCNANNTEVNKPHPILKSYIVPNVEQERGERISANT